MGKLENLNSQEAIKKLKDLAEDTRICMFCTELGMAPMSTRPMSLQEVDEEGNLWFISSDESNKNFEIKEDNRTQLIFSNPGDMEFLSVYGNAHIYKDRKTIEDKWTSLANAWFEGKDDPAVTIIRVSPLEGYYWDSTGGKMINFLKYAAAAVTGKKHADGSVEGSLKV